MVTVSIECFLMFSGYRMSTCIPSYIQSKTIGNELGRLGKSSSITYVTKAGFLTVVCMISTTPRPARFLGSVRLNWFRTQQLVMSGRQRSP